MYDITNAQCDYPISYQSKCARVVVLVLDALAHCSAYIIFVLSRGFGSSWQVPNLGEIIPKLLNLQSCFISPGK